MWLIPQQQEVYGAAATQAIRQAARENFNKKAIIITSTLTFVEVLSATLTDNQEREFRKSFRSLDHTCYDLTPPIAMKARDYRERLKKDGLSLKTPDAIHLATAATFKAEFWSFDEKLLRLNGDERIDRLTVCKPWGEPCLF